MGKIEQSPIDSFLRFSCECWYGHGFASWIARRLVRTSTRSRRERRHLSLSSRQMWLLKDTQGNLHKMTSHEKRHTGYLSCHSLPITTALVRCIEYRDEKCRPLPCSGHPKSKSLEFSSLSRCPLQLHPPYPFDSAKTIGLVFWRASRRQLDFMLSHITTEKPLIPRSLASWAFLMIHVWSWHTDSAALDSEIAITP